MKVMLEGNTCEVVRESTDKKVYSDSTLLYKVKQELIKQGYDVIKKPMWKDGHMISDTESYIRERSGKFGIFFADYALRFAYEDFNNKGQVCYSVEDLTEEECEE